MKKAKRKIQICRSGRISPASMKGLPCFEVGCEWAALGRGMVVLLAIQMVSPVFPFLLDYIRDNVFVADSK